MPSSDVLFVWQAHLPGSARSRKGGAAYLLSPPRTFFEVFVKGKGEGMTVGAMNWLTVYKAEQKIYQYYSVLASRVTQKNISNAVVHQSKRSQARFIV